MTFNRPTAALLALAVVLGAAGAMTGGTAFLQGRSSPGTAAAKTAGTTHKGSPRMWGAEIDHAAKMLTGSARLIETGTPAAAKALPASGDDPATRNDQPQNGRTPAMRDREAPAVQHDPAPRDEPPEKSPAPAMRGTDSPSGQKTVVARNNFPASPTAA
jgi:hypothetical protein